MTTLINASVRSTAPAAAFFERWADMATWPQWNLDTDWVRLDGSFAEGATGVLKPKGGPKVRFTVERLVPGRVFVDVSHLLGARLVFDHRVIPLDDGGCTVEVTAAISGPLRLLWTAILGAGIRASAQADLDRLAAVAEGRQVLA